MAYRRILATGLETIEHKCAALDARDPCTFLVLGEKWIFVECKLTSSVFRERQAESYSGCQLREYDFRRRRVWTWIYKSGWCHDDCKVVGVMLISPELWGIVPDSLYFQHDGNVAGWIQWRFVSLYSMVMNMLVQEAESRSWRRNWSKSNAAAQAFANTNKNSCPGVMYTFFVDVASTLNTFSKTIPPLSFSTSTERTIRSRTDAMTRLNDC